MATIEVDLQLRDTVGDTGHTWWPYQVRELGVPCEFCNGPDLATWVRITNEHPNYMLASHYCGTCASNTIRAILKYGHADIAVWVVIQGLEFGYEWEAEFNRDKDGADS